MGLSDLLLNFALLCTPNIHLFDFHSKILSVESEFPDFIDIFIDFKLDTDHLHWDE